MMIETLSQTVNSQLNARAKELFNEHDFNVRRQTDRFFAILLSLQFVAGVAAAYFISPLTWAGSSSAIHPHIWSSVLAGGAITSFPLFLVVFRPGEKINGYIVGASQMLMSALLIHLTGGRIETHFHIFGSLAFIAFYRDWKVLIPATIVTALDHLIRGWFFPASIYGILTGAEWRWAEHVFWVVFTDVFLIGSCRRSVREMWDIAHRTADLDASETRYRAVVEQTDEAIFLVDPDTLEVTECNKGFVKLLGYRDIDEAKSVPCHVFSFMEEDEVRRMAKTHIANGTQIRKETEYRHKDGGRVHVEIRVTPIKFGVHNALSINARNISKRKESEEQLRSTHAELEQRVEARTKELVDSNAALEKEISERARAEDDLREAKEFYFKVINHIPIATFVRNSRGRYILANQALADMYNTTVDNIIDKPAAHFVTNKEEQKMILQADKDILQTLEEKVIPEQGFIDDKGDKKWLQIIKRPLVSANGKNKHVLGIFIDLTQRKTIESQLRHSQKMESIGQLAAGIAHEINTPTQYVGDNIRFINDSFSDIQHVLNSYKALEESVRLDSSHPEKTAEIDKAIEEADLDYLVEEVPMALQQSLEGVSRIAKIVESMRDFAHPGSNEKTIADLNKAIQSTITVAQNKWKYIANMECNFDDSLPLVPCLVAEFNQVILNLIVNATHAIGDVVGHASQGKGTITISTSKVNEDWVEISLSDTGTGIPEEAQSRVFEPFFTTKDVGQGTGQGLAISHKVIVEKHNGELKFETEQGVGTKFIIRLPVECPPSA